MEGLLELGVHSFVVLVYYHHVLLILWLHLLDKVLKAFDVMEQSCQMAINVNTSLLVTTRCGLWVLSRQGQDQKILVGWVGFVGASPDLGLISRSFREDSVCPANLCSDTDLGVTDFWLWGFCIFCVA